MSVEVQPVVRTLTQAQINAYADASGDHNPIHVDETFAKSTPFEGTIAHGMLVLALIGEMMYAGLGEAWSAGGKLKVRFKAPTRPGDTVTASAQLTKTAAGVSEYAVQCANQRGDVLIEGRATVGAAA
jgi:3-hydroxybutyryl-CoA dehydratase